MHKLILRAMKNTLLNRAVPLLILAALSVVSVAGGQQTSTQPKKMPPAPADPASLPIATSNLEKGAFHPRDVETIARWHAVQAIPALKTQFERSKDRLLKAALANALVRLGEKQGPYWDFLADQALHVLQDVPPTPFGTDAGGKVIVGKPSKRFVEWANQHNMSPRQAWEYTIDEAVGSIDDLGTSDDRRAIPILREALASENYYIEYSAARGLAALHDTASVPAIIVACENAPKEAAALIARSLVWFDDPAAQRAVDAYVPKSTAKLLRKGRALGETPFGVIPSYYRAK